MVTESKEVVTEGEEVESGVHGMILHVSVGLMVHVCALHCLSAGREDIHVQIIENTFMYQAATKNRRCVRT